MNERDQDPYEIPHEWDHLPSQKELSAWMMFLPGVEYCWTLVKNIGKAKKHGWGQIRLSSSQGIVGSVQPIQAAGIDVILLCRGKPIPGATTAASTIVWRIDPELEGQVKKPLSIAPVDRSPQQKAAR